MRKIHVMYIYICIYITDETNYISNQEKGRYVCKSQSLANKISICI